MELLHFQDSFIHFDSFDSNKIRLNTLYLTDLQINPKSEGQTFASASVSFLLGFLNMMVEGKVQEKDSREGQAGIKKFAEFSKL